MTWHERPFRLIDAEGRPWAVVTNLAYFLGVQSPSNLPDCGAEEAIQVELRRMLSLTPEDPEIVSVAKLTDWLRIKDYAEVAGVRVDVERLSRLLMKAKTDDLRLWNASRSFDGVPCLGLEAPRWKAFLMGVEGAEDVYVWQPVADEDIYAEVALP